METKRNVSVHSQSLYISYFMMNLNVLIKFSTQYLNIFMLIQNSVEGLIWCYSWESCFGCPYGVTHAPFFEINKSNINTNSPLKYIKNLSEKNFCHSRCSNCSRQGNFKMACLWRLLRSTLNTKSWDNDRFTFVCKSLFIV